MLFLINLFKRKILNSLTLRKVLVIFLVGFISRVLVNYFYDINVFKEYTNNISLIYYGVMAFFVGFVNDLPKISLNLGNISLVRKWISSLILNRREEMFLNGGGLYKSVPNDKLKISDVLFGEKGREKGKGKSIASKSSGGKSGSAALGGLYGRKVSGSEPSAALKGLYSIDSKERKSTGLYSKEGKSNRTQVRDSNKLVISKPFDPQGSTLDKIDAFTIGSRTIDMTYSPSTNNVVEEVNYNSVTNNVTERVTSDNNTVTTNNITPSSYVNDNRNSGGSYQSYVYGVGYQSQAQNPVPGAPRISRLSTPSTMSPLFPSECSENNQSKNFVSGASRTGYSSDHSLENNSNSNNLGDKSCEESGITSFSKSTLFQTVVEQRRRYLDETFNNRVYILGKGFSSEELVISQFGDNKIKLGFKFLDNKYHKGKSKFESIYVKYNEGGRRKFYWCVWERKNGNFSSYNEFRQFWNSSQGRIWREMNKEFGWDIKSTVEELVRLRDPFKKNK